MELGRPPIKPSALRDEGYVRFTPVAIKFVRQRNISRWANGRHGPRTSGPVNGHSGNRVTGLESMRQLLGIDLNVPRPWLVEKDEYQGVAWLGHCIAALARYFSGHAACIFRNHLTEAIALDGNLLSGFDLVVEFDQMLNETARGRPECLSPGHA